MLTYQVRPRVFRHAPGQLLLFPAMCKICFRFQPPQPFGAQAGGGRTAVKAAAASMIFNSNTGQHTIESKTLLSPLDVSIKDSVRTIRLRGTLLSISQSFSSLREMEELIESTYFVLPSLVNIPFSDPPYIERVDGTVGSTSFRWELDGWRIELLTTTQEDQERSFARAWERMGVLSESHRRRLVAGLHYFHVACRLARMGSTAGEFVAEVVLNLAKSIEVLFPPTGDGRTRDAARKGLRALGFTDSQIESDFLPAMALRNEVDVAHVELGLFKMDQLKVIHAFTERAESAFRDMFERVLVGVESGATDVAPHELGPPREEVLKLIERLRGSNADARKGARMTTQKSDPDNQ